MHLFVLIAGVMGVALFVAGLRRPRVAVFVAAILWLLYAYYETLIANGTLCDSNCNIRVDLVLFFPILGIATFCAFRAYERPPGPPTLAANARSKLRGLIESAYLDGDPDGARSYMAAAWAVRGRVP